jgi:hypothetical protein
MAGGKDLCPRWSSITMRPNWVRESTAELVGTFLSNFFVTGSVYVAAILGALADHGRTLA